MSAPRVCVVLLNYRGACDTIECLESLFGCEPAPEQVVVCDNASGNGSLDAVEAWAAGRWPTCVPADPRIADHVGPPRPKPIAAVRLDRRSAERGGDPRVGAVPLVLVDNGENLGFAGGNNVGLRFARARGFDYVWVLNNDTVVRRDALAELIARAARVPRLGICGSQLRYHHDPERVQALGGAVYDPWLARTRHVGVGGRGAEIVDEDAVARGFSYVVGASMLVSAAFLREVGLLDERYFLYFEELDWAIRARDRFTLAYAHRSIVFHKEGASIGSNSRDAAGKSALADYYLLRNRVIATWRHFPFALPTVYAGLAVAAANRVRRGQWSRLRLVAMAALGPLAPRRLAAGAA